MQQAKKDLTKVIAQNHKAKAQWNTLTPIAQRDFATWIDSAKQIATREGRIKKACSMLASGKKRPCCYAVVPMGLYKALGTNAKAKATWKMLTPDNRRDFADWVDSAKNPEEQKERIKRACVMLASGKQHP